MSERAFPLLRPYVIQMRVDDLHAKKSRLQSLKGRVKSSGSVAGRAAAFEASIPAEEPVRFSTM